MMLAFQRRDFTAFQRILAAAVLALLAPTQVQAQEGGRGFDPREIYLLPVYCKYTQIYRKNVPGGNNPAEIQRWTEKMGGNNMFQHMHHYCWALQASNPVRLARHTPDMRRHQLLLALGDLDYVIAHAPPDFSYLPEIHTKKGEVLIQLDRPMEGTLEYQRAIRIKADYWQAYAAMSDFYKERGQAARAREWLEKGLAQAPSAKGLTQRLAELDSAQGKRKNDPPQRTAR